MNKTLILVVGLILLVLGTSITLLTWGRVIPNVQNYTVDWMDPSNPVLVTTNRQTKEYLLFEGVFESGDKLKITVHAYGDGGYNAFSGSEGCTAFTLTLDFTDETNQSLRHMEYDSFPSDGAVSSCPDVYDSTFVQIERYDTYRIYVAFTAFEEKRQYSGHTWSAWSVEPYNSTLTRQMTTKIEAQKAALNQPSLITGVTLLSVGIILSILAIVKRGHANLEVIPPPASAYLQNPSNQLADFFNIIPGQHLVINEQCIGKH